MKHLAVLSNHAQWRIFRKKYALADSNIFCDSSPFGFFLKKEGLSFCLLNEFFLKSKWNTINAWGAAKAAEWGKIYAEAYPERINWAAVIFLHFSYLLVQLVKNYEYAKHLILTEKHSGVLIFETNRSKNYPAFSGNFYLNFFLEDLAKQHAISIEKVLIDTPSKKNSAGSFQARFKGHLKYLARSVLNGTCKPSLRPYEAIDVLAYGALAHLQPVIESLVAAKRKIAIYDFEFHRDQFLLARRLKVPYLIPACFVQSNLVDFEKSSRECIDSMTAIFEKPDKGRYWFYDGYDFSPVIRSHVFPRMQSYFERCLKEKDLYDRLFSNGRIKSLLVDEDFGLKCTFMTSYASQKRIPVHCVSHANFAVDFAVPVEKRFFAKGWTYTHSQFEKDMYAARGWNPAVIIPAGMPRFDEYAKISAKKHHLKTKYPFHLLYCAGVLWDHTPDVLGYLGSHICGLRETQEPAFLDVLCAIRDLPVSLFVKTHNYEDEASWKKLLKKQKSSENVHFVKHSTDLAGLLRESNAMVVSYWSTTIIQAALLDKIVFYYEPRPTNSPCVLKYEKAGFCKIVYTPEQLRKEIERYVQSPQWCTGISSASSDEKKYYLGLNDGRGAQRVADYVMRNDYA